MQYFGRLVIFFFKFRFIVPVKYGVLLVRGMVFYQVISADKSEKTTGGGRVFHSIWHKHYI